LTNGLPGLSVGSSDVHPCASANLPSAAADESGGAPRTMYAVAKGGDEIVPRTLAPAGIGSRPAHARGTEPSVKTTESCPRNIIVPFATASRNSDEGERCDCAHIGDASRKGPQHRMTRGHAASARMNDLRWIGA
jgi:hypothetical protein